MRTMSHACAANRSACPLTMDATLRQETRVDATSSCNPRGRTAMSAPPMGGGAIQLGDRVINLQVPGIFTVIDRDGPHVVIETARGLRMTVLDSQVRRVDDATPPSTDA